MSKSLGNVLDPFEVIERFGADALRYYCFREVSFGQDGSVSPAGFEARYETELANEYGNLASRTLAMIDRYRDGLVPEARAGPRAGRGRRRPRRAGVARRRAPRPGRADPGAGGDLEARAPAEPVRRGDPALGPGQGRRQARPARPGPLRPGRGPAGRRPCCCTRTCPRPRTGCSTRSARRSRELAAFGSRGGGQPIGKLAPLFPKIETAAALTAPAAAVRASARAPRLAAVVDTHAHLGSASPPAARAGRRRAPDRGPPHPHRGHRRGRPTPRRSPPPRRTRRCSPASGAIRTAAGRLRRRRGRRRSRSWPATSAWRRSGRPGSTSTATGPRARSSERAFEAQIAIARRTGLPLVIHVRDRRAATRPPSETFATLAAEAEGVTVILHCFSAPPERVGEAAERGWYCSFAGNVTYPKAEDLREAARAGPRGAAAGRDRLALPGAAAGARQAQPAGQRGRDRRAACRGARGRLRGAGANRRGQRRAGLRW